MVSLSVKYGGSECLSLYCEQISEVTKIEFFLHNSDLKIKEFIIFQILQKSQVVFLSVILFHALFLSWGQLHVWAGSLSDRLSSAQKANLISFKLLKCVSFQSGFFFFNNTISSKIALTPIGKMFHCSISPHPASFVRWFWARKGGRKLLKGLKFQYASTKKGIYSSTE